MPNPNTLFDPTTLAEAFPDAVASGHIDGIDPHRTPYEELGRKFSEHQVNLGIAAQAGVSVDTATTVANLMNTPAHHSLDSLSLQSPEAKTLVESYIGAYEASTKLFGLVGEALPDVHDPKLTETLASLLDTFKAIEKLGQTPEVTVYPRHRQLNFWVGLGNALQDSPLNPTDPGNNSRKLIRDGGLWISDTVQNNWAELTNLDNETSGWTVAVMASEERPYIVNVTSYGYTDASNTEASDDLNSALVKMDKATIAPRVPTEPLHQPDIHPEIEGYVTHQFSRIIQNKSPLDPSTYTWLNGTVKASGDVPDGDWNPDHGQVSLSYRDAGFLNDIAGVRPSGRG